MVGVSGSLGQDHQTQPHFKGRIIVCMCIQCEVDTRQMLTDGNLHRKKVGHHRNLYKLELLMHSSQ